MSRRRTPPPLPPADPPVWVAGASREARRERRQQRRELKAPGRAWRMRYELTYSNGTFTFDRYYRTYLGARWSAFWYLYFRAWGGFAELHRTGN